MARNVYFSLNARNEQNLYEDLVVETLSMFGHETLYLPRELIERDHVLNDVQSKFGDAHQIEMYIENTDGFEGDGSLMSKFGLEIRDQATFIVSRRQWTKLVGVWNNTIKIDKPIEGDLIYIPLSNTYFEIKYVDTKNPFYQLNNLPVYRIQAEVFEYSGEELDTGIDEIDDIQKRHETEHVFGISDGNDIDFEIGEIVTQEIAPASVSTDAIIMYGEVSSFKIEDKVKYVYLHSVRSSNGSYGKFRVSGSDSDKLIGSNSNAEWSIISRFDIDNSEEFDFINDDNRSFEVEADVILDFDEVNPFGDISDV